MGEVREGEAAFRCETIIARFPHPNPPPSWGRGNLCYSGNATMNSAIATKQAMVRTVFHFVQSRT